MPENKRPDSPSEIRLSEDIRVVPLELRSSVRFLPSLIMVMAGTLLIMFSRIWIARSPIDEQLTLYMGIGGLMLIVLGAAASSLAYLSGGPRRTESRSAGRGPAAILEELAAAQESHLAELQNRVLSQLTHTAQAAVSLSPEDRAEISRSIKSQITQDVASDILKEIAESGKTRFSQSDIAELRSRYGQAKERLSQEVSALSRRGNLNLVIGGVTTISAVALLAYIVLNADATHRDLESLAWHYVPRLSVAVFIEVFSFFFLRLYRNSLDEIKFFQNEITNIDSRVIALEAAIMAQDYEALRKLIDELARTERNFRLQKGESTVELERAKLDSQGVRDFVANLTKVVRRQ